MSRKRDAYRIRGALELSLDWHAVIGHAEDPIAREEERSFTEWVCLSTGNVSARPAAYAPTCRHPAVGRQR